MYRGLTAKTPGCVTFSLPVQRLNLWFGASSVFPIPPQPAQRATDTGVAVSTPSGVRS